LICESESIDNGHVIERDKCTMSAVASRLSTSRRE
jgi:hypothetical protein